MSDIDGNFETDRGDGPEMASEPVQRALSDFRDEIETAIEAERQRADAAERSLAELRLELAAVQTRVEAARRGSRAAEEHISRNLQECLAHSVEAQAQLIGIARQLLRRLDHSQSTPVPNESKAAYRALEGRESGAPVGGTTEGPAASPSVDQPGPDHDWLVGGSGTTDEHRTIDQSNRADMERLDSPSRLFVGSAVLRRRNLLMEA